VKHKNFSPVVAIANQKGGVGKTTSCINLAASLAAMDQRVLVLDMDPQGNSSTGLGVAKDKVKFNIYDVLTGNASLQDTIAPTACEGLYIVPASMDLAGAEVELVSVDRREYILLSVMNTYDGQPFDCVFIDCPPALNLLTINALTAADQVLIPLQTEFYALEGLTQLLDTIHRIRQGTNPDLGMGGILLTMVDRRNNLTLQVEKEVRDYFGSQVFNEIIPRNIRLSEAPSFGLPVLQHDVRSKGAQAYLAVAREMMERETRQRRLG